MLLIGLRGVGKTVLLRHLAETARKDGVVPVVVEVRSAKTDIEELSLRLKESLSTIDFASKVKAKVNYAFSVLSNFVRAFAINIGDFGVTVELAQGVASSGKMELDLSEVLIACARAAKDAETAIGLYIDELQNLDIEAMRGIIVALHRSAQESLPLYMVGSGLPSIRGLIGKSKTYAERMFNYADVGALNESDVDAAITIPMNANGLDIELSAIKEIFRATQGYPYFLQEYGYQVWLAANGESITAKEILSIGEAVERRLDANFFDVRFDRVSNIEKSMLRFMADFPSEASVSVSELAERMGRTLSSLSPIRSSLIKKGMIYSPKHGCVAYTVPMFGEYMKRVMP